MEGHGGVRAVRDCQGAGESGEEQEKILAAKRAGIKDIIISNENKKDIAEIKEIYIKGLKFNYVSTISDVLDIALLKQKVKNAKKIE